MLNKNSRKWLGNRPQEQKWEQTKNNRTSGRATRAAEMGNVEGRPAFVN